MFLEAALPSAIKAPEVKEDAVGIAQLDLVNLAVCLRSALKDRDLRAGGWEDAETQHYADATISNLLSTLKVVPAQKWLEFAKVIEPDPIIAAALTWCEGATWENVVTLALHHQLRADPLSASATGAGFADAPLELEAAISAVLRLGQTPSVVSLLLAMLNRAPTLDVEFGQLERLASPVACQLAWFFARDGYAPEQERLLVAWQRRDDDEALHFWSGASLALRSPKQKANLKTLQSIAGSDPHRQLFATTMKNAMSAGPLTAEDVPEIFRSVFQRPRLERFHAVLQLAVFGPANAPIIDPFAATVWQKRWARRMKIILQSGLEQGAFQTRLQIAQKVSEAKAAADSARKHMEDIIQMRGWSAETTQEALETPPAWIGPAGQKRYVHPRTGLSLITSAHAEVIHVGRATYVYEPGNVQGMTTPAPQPESDVLQMLKDTEDIRLATIYVKLRNEQINVWRPVQASFMGDEVYCILPQNPSGDEQWEFNMLTHVICKHRQTSAGAVLVALRRADLNQGR